MHDDRKLTFKLLLERSAGSNARPLPPRQPSAEPAECDAYSDGLTVDWALEGKDHDWVDELTQRLSTQEDVMCSR
jgi:hypothetical protein